MGLGPYKDLRVDQHDRVFVITLQKAPENRLNVRFAQEIIRALRDIEVELGPDSEGCVITRGNDEKFWCTGLELDESDTNPFANSDGFFPVRYSFTRVEDIPQRLFAIMKLDGPLRCLLYDD
jgi:enoyl-CoA hydratase/carnithine racemase